MPQTNKRGRPPGSSWLNATDYPILERVADRMILDPAMKPTTAMRAIGVNGEADQRRLREKWKPVAARYLLEARARREAAIAEGMRNTLAEIGMMAGRFALAGNAIVEGMRASFMRWAAENRETADGVRIVAERLRAVQQQRRLQDARHR